MVLMKATALLCVLLCLLWSLVEIQSQAEYPHLTLRGTYLPNHSYVDISQVGANRDTNTVRCLTDLVTCCHDDQEVPRGDWFAPGSDTRLGDFYDYGYNIFQSRNALVVHLRRRNNANGPTGIYRCVIGTNATHSDSDGSVGETVYVGLYGSGGGNITISDGMAFTLNSDLNEASPQFTLTCISTGGPATTVTWTRDSVLVSEETDTVLDNRVTSQYTHTLTVTGRLGGLYTCTVANNKPSEDSANYTVQVASAPTNLTAVQKGPTSVRVSWSPPTPLGDTTGYRIYYSGGSSGSEDVSDGYTDNYLLTGLQNGESCTIIIESTSSHIFSDRVGPVMVALRTGHPSVSVTSITSSSISLSWSVPSGSVVTSYEVMWRALSSGDEANDDGGSGTSGSITSTSYTIQELESNTVYSVTVTAINDVGIAVSKPIITVTECSHSVSDSNGGSVAGGVIVAVVFIITTALTVIVIVVLVLRRNREDSSISAGLQKDLDVIHMSNNEAYTAMKQNGETDTCTDAPPSLPPSSQPTAEDHNYEPMQYN